MVDLDNWKAAGLFAGRSYADELRKLALVHLLDKAIEEKAQGDEKIAGPLMNKAMGLLKRMAPVGKAIGLAGVTGAAAGSAGKVIGAKMEREKADQELASAAPQIFRVGFIQGARQGFLQGARAGFVHAKGERVE